MLALARYSAASGHDSLGVAHAQHAAGQGDQQRDDHDANSLSHGLSMAAGRRTDRNNCVARGLA